MTCECISKIDAALEKRNINAAIETNMFGQPMCLIRLYKVDTKNRGKSPFLQASHCPFCGTKYKENEDEEYIPSSDAI